MEVRECILCWHGRVGVDPILQRRKKVRLLEELGTEIGAEPGDINSPILGKVLNSPVQELLTWTLHTPRRATASSRFMSQGS